MSFACARPGEQGAPPTFFAAAIPPSVNSDAYDGWFCRQRYTKAVGGKIKDSVFVNRGDEGDGTRQGRPHQ